MGKLNLLTGSFTGSLGVHYGAKTLSGVSIKARPFSKTPPTKKQTDCVRSFEALNRISSSISKKFWQFLLLSDKTVLKHNAVATWLKVSIENHQFNPSAIGSIIPEDGTASIISMDFNQLIGRGNVIFSLTPPPSIHSADRVLCIVFDENGKTYFCEAGIFSQGFITFFGIIPEGRLLYSMIFRSSSLADKRIVHGFSLFSIMA